MANSKCVGDLERLTQKYKEKEIIKAIMIVDCGKLFKSITKIVLDEVHTKLSHPLRAVNAVVQLGIPTSKYEKFSSLMKV